MAHIFRNRYGGGDQSDPKRCRAAVHDDYGVNFHQCVRKPVVFRCIEGGEYGFCRQHDPEVVAERRAKRHAQYEAKWAAQRAQNDRHMQTRKAQDAAKAALEQIAAGHNDPRSLAAEVLAMFPSPSPAQGPLPLGDDHG